MTRRSTLIAAAFLLLAVRVSATGPQTEADVPRITIDEYKQAREKNQVITLDVRGPDAYRVSHITGSIPLTYGEDLKPRAEEYKKAGKIVVTYCTCPSEHSAARVALDLLQLGVKDVRALKGGLGGWSSAGGATTTGDEAPLK